MIGCDCLVVSVVCNLTSVTYFQHGLLLYVDITSYRVRGEMDFFCSVMYISGLGSITERTSTHFTGNFYTKFLYQMNINFIECLDFFPR